MIFDPSSFVDIDDCEPAPCQNGGTCDDAVNAFLCTCDEGFAGNDCSVGKIKGNPLDSSTL